MKNFICIVLFLLIANFIHAQIKPSEGGILSQSYSKAITEYRAKEYLIKEVINTPNKVIVDLDISAITASGSGELTTIVYNCESQKKRGLLFVFWNDQVNDFNLRYKGYGFRHFEYNAAKDILDTLEVVIDQNKSILSTENDVFSKNAVYKWDDLTFLFYKNDFGSNLIRVFWTGFDSEWNQSNFRTTKKRFEKFFNRN